MACACGPSDSGSVLLGGGRAARAGDAQNLLSLLRRQHRHGLPDRGTGAPHPVCESESRALQLDQRPPRIRPRPPERARRRRPPAVPPGRRHQGARRQPRAGRLQDHRARRRDDRWRRRAVRAGGESGGCGGRGSVRQLPQPERGAAAGSRRRQCGADERSGPGVRWLGLDARHAAGGDHRPRRAHWTPGRRPCAVSLDQWRSHEHQRIRGHRHLRVGERPRHRRGHPPDVVSGTVGISRWLCRWDSMGSREPRQQLRRLGIEHCRHRRILHRDGPGQQGKRHLVRGHWA